MNLIEKLGLEKCKKIVDGAPEGARAYNTKSKYYASGAWFYRETLLSDIKAQVDLYYYGQREQKELEQYAVLSQEKIEGGAMLVVITRQVQMVRDITDNCTDIKNHISPNTKVIER